jgi:hypothetical protein
MSRPARLESPGRSITSRREGTRGSRSSAMTRIATHRYVSVTAPQRASRGTPRAGAHPGHPPRFPTDPDRQISRIRSRDTAALAFRRRSAASAVAALGDPPFPQACGGLRGEGRLARARRQGTAPSPWRGSGLEISPLLLRCPYVAPTALGVPRGIGVRSRNIISHKNARTVKGSGLETLPSMVRACLVHCAWSSPGRSISDLSGSISIRN